MSNYLREWKKFLTEEYELTVNPNDYANFQVFKKDFKKAMKNKAFFESFMETFLRLVIKEFFNDVLSQDDRRKLFRDVKLNSDNPNINFINKEIENESLKNQKINKR